MKTKYYKKQLQIAHIKIIKTILNKILIKKEKSIFVLMKIWNLLIMIFRIDQEDDDIDEDDIDDDSEKEGYELKLFAKFESCQCCRGKFRNCIILNFL